MQTMEGRGAFNPFGASALDEAYLRSLEAPEYGYPGQY